MSFSKKILFAAALALVVAFSASDVQAGNPMEKLGRGLAQIVMSPFEIPIQVQDIAAEQGNVASLSYGLIRGICFTVARIVVGAGDVVTFLVPLPGCEDNPYEDGWGYGPMAFTSRPWIFDVEHNWFGFFYDSDALVGPQY